MDLIKIHERAKKAGIKNSRKKENINYIFFFCGKIQYKFLKEIIMSIKDNSKKENNITAANEGNALAIATIMLDGIAKPIKEDDINRINDLNRTNDNFKLRKSCKKCIR